MTVITKTLKLAGWDATNWDLNTQQPHGGQEWSSMGDKFVEDFSVTTNFMGPPESAVTAARDSLQNLEHYPAANFEPALSDLAEWLVGSGETSIPADVAELKSRMILGNGASELIDLVTRLAAPAGGFQQGSTTVQYKEYERAAMAAQPMKKMDKNSSSFTLARSGDSSTSVSTAGDDDKFAILAVVNPCNPTGEYRTVEELKAFIAAEAESNGKPGCCVLVDESMQLWHGEHWRKDSLISQQDWIRSMYEENGVSVYLIHSWTKIWSCPGIRLGSVLTPTAALCQTLKAHQVPWSVNICGLAFLSAAIADEKYLLQTWELTPRFRQMTIDSLKQIPAFAEWEYLGANWTSWIWIDTKDAKQAEAVVRVAKAAGCPVRNGAMGYGMPTFLRFAVRAPEHQQTLLTALQAEFQGPTGTAAHDDCGLEQSSSSSTHRRMGA
jgi:histidinol-phosphate/aromatic aminotransferase/cobyric acid decarboxylase-like protein